MSRKDIDALFQQAVQFHHAGDLVEAQHLYHQILELDSRHADAQYFLGASLLQQKNADDAMVTLKNLLTQKPYYANAHATLGEAYLAKDDLLAAISSLEQAATLDSKNANAFLNLGTAWQRSGDTTKALACFGQSLKLNPNSADGYFNLANLLRELGQLDPAIDGYRRAIAMRQNFLQAWSNLGYTLKATGRLADSLHAFQQALAIDPTHAAIHSGIVYLLQFQPGQSQKDIYNAHVDWNTRHAAAFSEKIFPHANDRNPTRRLRIGYVSPDFRNHCQTFFTLPLLENHNHADFEIYLYADLTQEDAITQRIKKCADVWRPTHTFSDDALAALIRSDQIDVLIDLTMHMANGRLMTFAQKPAPLQLTWLAYPGTTGLSTIDHRLTDPHLDPPGMFDDCYSEESHRLPDTFWCYDPLTTTPQINSLPALTAGHVTFGCLNNFCKVNPDVIALWSKVLQAVGGSKLLLLCPEGETRKQTLATFAANKVAEDRIEFTAPLPREQYLALYNRIDLVLDTFPYNGHTTSLDGLWMGVPMITLVGETVVGRAGLSQLTNLHLPQFIAHTPEQFVTIATQTAADLPALASLRHSLHEVMQSSPLMNGPRFTRAMEFTYRNLWRQYCDSYLPTPPT